MSVREDVLDAAEKTLEGAAQAVEKLLERPDALLDPASSEAQDIAKEARTFMKLFFDAGQERCPAKVRKTSDGLMSLVTDGFEAEQIWEELEVQNIPLRRHLRQHVKRLSQASQGAVNLQIDLPVELAPPSRMAKAAEPAPVVGKKHRRDPEPPKGLEVAGDVRACEASEEEGHADSDDEKEASPTGEPSQLEDGFFSVEEMNKFADLAEKPGGMRLNEDADSESDFGMFEGLEGDEGDEDDGEDGKTAKFSDFFDPVSEASATAPVKDRAAERMRRIEMEMEDDEEEEEEEEEGLGLEAAGDLSDEERDLEEQIKQLQAEGADDGEDDENEEAEDEEGDGAEEEEEGDDSDGEAEAKVGNAGKVREKTLYEMDRKLQALEEEVAKLEEEQLEGKHWSLRGEVSAKERPLNSLLEVHLDQPMTQLAGNRAGEAAAAAGAAEGEDALDDVPGADAVVKAAGFDVDAIIRQRVWDEAFDDVIRRTELPPSQRPQGADEDVVETLNFQKSRVGLGDIYAQQYEADLLGHKTEAQTKEDKDKAETKMLFAKLMYKLDQLTNAHFTPRPPMLGVSGEQLDKVQSIKMEETIPLMVSDASLKAPEEVRAPRRHDRERNEFQHEDRQASRRAKKVARRRSLERRVESGELTLAGRREREAKLQEKNTKAKQEKANIGVVKEQKKKLKASELMAQAAENASSGVSRKEDMRRERQKRTESTVSSKRVKL